MKKIYLKDIAKSLNLSKTTVSLVLNEKGNENKISVTTQKRIKNYAKKHNYVPNHLARGLSRGKSDTIGLIIPNISDIFYAQIAGHIEKKATNYGYTVVFSSSHENAKNEQKLIRSMVNRQVDGLIIASTQQNLKNIRQLRQNKFPLVLIDRHYPEDSSNYIIVNNFISVKNATNYLLGLGRRHIAFITVKLELEAIRQRLLGYHQAIKEVYGDVKQELIVELNPKNYDREMKAAIEKLLNQSNKVDAMIFSTHYLTASGLRELKNLKINIPEEVALVSFDELSAFDLVDPPITSIMQPVEDMGNLAVEILLDEISGLNIKKHKKVVLETELIIRKSCGA